MSAPPGPISGASPTTLPISRVWRLLASRGHRGCAEWTVPGDPFTPTQWTPFARASLFDDARDLERVVVLAKTSLSSSGWDIVSYSYVDAAGRKEKGDFHPCGAKKLGWRTTTCGFVIPESTHSPQDRGFHGENHSRSPLSCDLNEFIDFTPGCCWIFRACQNKQSGMYMHINTNQNLPLRNISVKCKWCRWPCPVGGNERKQKVFPPRQLEHLFSSSSSSPSMADKKTFFSKSLWSMKQCELLNIDNCVPPSQAGIICIVLKQCASKKKKGCVVDASVLSTVCEWWMRVWKMRWEWVCSCSVCTKWLWHTRIAAALCFLDAHLSIFYYFIHTSAMQSRWSTDNDIGSDLWTQKMLNWVAPTSLHVFVLPIWSDVQKGFKYRGSTNSVSTYGAV